MVPTDAQNFLKSSVESLKRCKVLLDKIDEVLFMKESKILERGTLGKHLRHVLEFYLCLFEGIESGTVCYENRKRDLKLESDHLYACQTIELIMGKLALLSADTPLHLKTSMTDYCEDTKSITSSVLREVMYCYDHHIHHQALMKIALQEFGFDQIDVNFGLAPSTVKYREQCAQ